MSANYWKKFQKYLLTNKKNKINSNDNLLKKVNNLSKNKTKKIWSNKFFEYNLAIKKEILFPNVSLVKNIGFDGTGVNSSITNKFNSPYYKTKIPKKIEFIKEKKLIEKQKLTLLKRVKYFF